jgi:hypothetical protein
MKLCTPPSDFGSPTVTLANSAGPNPFEALQNDTVAIDDDGWALIAPFGRWPKTRVFNDGGQVKEQKFIQVVDNEAVDSMVGKENSLFSKLKRAWVGIPIYKGHGDLRDHDPKALGNDQKIKLGVVDKIRKTPRGIEAHFALDNDGAEAVGAGWKLPSSLWLVQPIGNEGDSILARPFKLLSVALTRFPNIAGVESLANQVDQAVPELIVKTETPQNMTLKENLIGLLVGRGITLPDPASDQDLFRATAALANADITPDSDISPEGVESLFSGDPDAASKKAFQASARAASPDSHAIAARAHQRAADAQKVAGNKSRQELHQTLAAFHIGQ